MQARRQVQGCKALGARRNFTCPSQRLQRRRADRCDVWANAHACDRRCHRQLLARAMRRKVLRSGTYAAALRLAPGDFVTPPPWGSKTRSPQKVTQRSRKVTGERATSRSSPSGCRTHRPLTLCSPVSLSLSRFSSSFARSVLSVEATSCLATAAGGKEREGGGRELRRESLCSSQISQSEVARRGSQGLEVANHLQRSVDVL